MRANATDRITEPQEALGVLSAGTLQNLGLLGKACQSHLREYLAQAAYRKTYAVTRALCELGEFVDGSEPGRDLTDPVELQVTLHEWTTSLLAHDSPAVRKTRRDRISALLNYIHSMIQRGQIPRIHLPSTIWKAPTPRPRRHKEPKTLADTAKWPDLAISCRKSNSSKNIEHDFSELSPLKGLASSIVLEFRRKYSGKSESVQFRAKRASIDFFMYAHSKSSALSLSDKSCLTALLVNWREALLRNRNGAAIPTRNDDWKELRRFLRHLMRQNILPTTSIPSPFTNADNFRTKNKTKRTFLSAALKGVTRKNESNETIVAAIDLPPHIHDDVFIQRLHEDERWAFDLIRKCAIADVKTAIRDFEYGQQLIKQCDIAHLRHVYRETNRLCDPDGPQGRGGYPTSFFSKDHPTGLVNFLGWVWFEHSGMLRNRSFPGFTHVHEHGGNETIKRYLGLTVDTALAFFLVILGELAYNVQTLERARLPDKSGHRAILLPTDKDTFKRISLPKVRANRVITKLASTGAETIDAVNCFSWVVQMTRQFRSASDSRDLWIHGYNSALTEPERIGPTAFKAAFRRFLHRHTELAPLWSAQVNRAMIRVSAGLLVFFETGGDLFKVAEKLGNSPQVALRNYVPQDYQDMFYRREIRRFQNVLIITATRGSGVSIPACGYQTRADLDSALDDILNGTNGRAYPVLKDFLAPRTEPSANTDLQIVFVLCEESIALLMLFCEHIAHTTLTDPDLQLDSPSPGVPLTYWMDLWALVQANLRNTADRGHKKTYDNGILLGNRIRGSLNFPSLI